MARLPSKNRIVKNILRMQRPDYDPILAMADMAHEEDIDDQLRFQCHKEVAKYCHPQLRAVEISTAETEELTKEEIITRLQELDAIEAKVKRVKNIPSAPVMPAIPIEVPEKELNTIQFDDDDYADDGLTLPDNLLD